jgi:hypothetical protein
VGDTPMDERESSKHAELRLDVSRSGPLLTPAVLAVLYDIIDVSHTASGEHAEPEDRAG